MRVVLLTGAILALAACGGSRSTPSGPIRPVATGEISRACVASGRDDATPQLCGCIQSVANQTLSERDRNRVVTFFEDPEVAHEVRYSDSRANDALWERYRNFINTSRAMCG